MSPLQVEQALRDRDECFQDPTLPILEFDDVMASIGDKLPITVSVALYGLLEASSSALEAPPAEASHSGSTIISAFRCLCMFTTSQGRALFLQPGEFDMNRVNLVLNAAEAALGPRDVPSFKALTQPLRALAVKYSNGILGANRDGLCDLLKRFLSVETHFGGGGRERRFEDVIFDIRVSGTRCV